VEQSGHSLVKVLSWQLPGGARGWTTEGSEFESRYGQEFSLLHFVHTGSGVHTTFHPMGSGDSFPGGKAARA
jgi:hypothetical protein